jgi:hypothetical protein
MKPYKKKQRPINSAFKATFQRELEKFLKVGIIFPVFSEWVSNWIHVLNTTDRIRTCISFRTFSQAIIRNHFPPIKAGMLYVSVLMEGG